MELTREQRQRIDENRAMAQARLRERRSMWVSHAGCVYGLVPVTAAVYCLPGTVPITNHLLFKTQGLFLNEPRPTQAEPGMADGGHFSSYSFVVDDTTTVAFFFSAVLLRTEFSFVGLSDDPMPSLSLSYSGVFFSRRLRRIFYYK